MAVFEFVKQWITVYMLSLLWGNLLQMLTLLTITKIFAGTRPEIARIFNFSVWFVAIFAALNLGVFFYSLFGGTRLAGCSKDIPNSLGGLLLKLLLVLFDTVLFFWQCFDWGLRHTDDETESETSKQTQVFK